MTNNTSYLSDKSFFSNEQTMKQKMTHLPKRIILVRHGQSELDEDETVLEYVPNYKVKLSKKGSHQAQMTGSKIREIISRNGESRNWKVFFYFSPSSRTKETMEGMICSGETFPKDKVVGVREEGRLREQHFGNFQDVENRKKIKRNRDRYGKFFYRVPDGESSADVYDRVSTFIEGLWWDMETNKFSNGPSDELNLIVISHGRPILLFLMKWFNWTVDQLESLINPGNCEYRVLQLGPDGEYSLALYHQVEELKKWGLSDEMIEHQILRARGMETLLEHKCVDACSNSAASSD